MLLAWCALQVSLAFETETAANNHLYYLCQPMKKRRERERERKALSHLYLIEADDGGLVGSQESD